MTAEERRAMRDDLNKESEEIDEEMERIKAEQEEAEEWELKYLISLKYTNNKIIKIELKKMQT